MKSVIDSYGACSRCRSQDAKICKEFTQEIYSKPYMQRHGTMGSGSLKSALDSLVASGELEIPKSCGSPQPIDPLLALWVRQRMNGVGSKA